jgi:DNA-binding NarL/FixJ family response regulator
MVVEGLRKVLEPEVDLVGTVGDGRALMKAAAKERPDIIIADISMPLLNGLDATREIKKELPEVKIIVLTMHTDIEFAEEAFRAGADGYLIKRCAAEELVSAIHKVRGGGQYITPLVAPDELEFFLDRASGKPRDDALTGRQREVLQLIAEGQSIKEIGATLNISRKTAEYHRYNIMAVLSLRSTAELTRYAIQHGILSLE